MIWSCPCGFDPDSVLPRFSAGWYVAHRDVHLRVFPNADFTTRANFDMFIRVAGQLDKDDA